MDKTPEEKRDLPIVLKKLLATDVQLTNMFVKYVERRYSITKLKSYSKMLEISCHGVPWIAGVLAFIWILGDRHLYQMQINLLIGLILDIVFIAIIKALTRRRRPALNDDPFAIGPDKYAFPSGHASRSSFVCYFFANLWPVSCLCIPFLFAWCIAVSISRILMRRHHILDVCAGILIGLFEAAVIQYIYLEAQTCINLVFWLTDEKLHGAEYDV